MSSKMVVLSLMFCSSSSSQGLGTTCPSWFFTLGWEESNSPCSSATKIEVHVRNLWFLVRLM